MPSLIASREACTSRKTANTRKRTGDLLGVHFGFHVAHFRYDAGLSEQRFGTDYRDNFFSAQFNTHKVQRHILEQDGSTFRIRSEDFLVSEDADFHPTDVLEDADGSLLVIVTGGWFVKSCHQRALRLDIKGAIYRIRRQRARNGRSLGPRSRQGAADAAAMGQAPGRSAVRAVPGPAQFDGWFSVAKAHWLRSRRCCKAADQVQAQRSPCGP